MQGSEASDYICRAYFFNKKEPLNKNSIKIKAIKKYLK